MSGAAGPTRTDDLTLTKRLLYQLSYSGVCDMTRERRGAYFTTEGSRAYCACERTRTITSTPST